MKIFINYRRADSADVAGRIYDYIRENVKGGVIFKDVDSIPLGVDFRTFIDEAVRGSDVMLVIIGNQWLSVHDENGRRRLDDPNDFVRLEIEAALRRNISVVPLFVQDVTGLSDQDLPGELRALAYRNGTRIRHDPDFHTDMDRLLRGLQGRSTPQPAAQPTQKPVEKPAESLPASPPKPRSVRPMTHKEKVKYMLADFEKRGLKKESMYYAPPHYRVLWFLGNEVVPPYFQSIANIFLVNFIMYSAFFFLFFFISIMSSGYNIDTAEITLLFLMGGGMSLFAGISATLGTRKRAKKLNLPPWKDYPST